MAQSTLLPATTYPAVVGRVLAEIRQARGVPQEALAQALEMTQSGWSRVERGDVAITVEQLALVAPMLNTSPGEVLQRADHAVRYAKDQGVRVEPRRVSAAVAGGLVLIGAAALAALIAAALMVEESEEG